MEIRGNRNSNLSSPTGDTSVTSTPVNYFIEFSLEPNYEIDLKDLERRYLERSKQVHPDRFVNAPTRDRVAALSASMAVNQAYNILKNDRLRAEHLLSLFGLSIDQGEKIDPTFLIEILEAREELAEALAASNHSLVRELEEAMLDRRDQALKQIERLFGKVREHPSASQAELAAIKRELISLRYIDRYLEAALEDD